MRMKPIETVALLARIGLGLLFVYASYDKILDPEAFARIIQNYRLLPASMIRPTALWLPWIELLCGLALVSGRMLKGSLLIINVLMLIFTAALGLNLWRGIDTSCGCFSVGTDAGGHTMDALLRDLAIWLPAFWLLMTQVTRSEEAR
jgi:uncharacterized membrane protein YphA (DoxX/SURF4 family)